MKTKYLSLLLAVVLCFGLAAPAFASGASSSPSYPTGTYSSWSSWSSGSPTFILNTYFDGVINNGRGAIIGLSNILDRLNAWNTSIGYLSNLSSMSIDTSTISTYVSTNLPEIKSNSDYIKSSLASIDGKLPSATSGFATEETLSSFKSALVSDKTYSMEIIMTAGGSTNFVTTTFPYAVTNGLLGLNRGVNWLYTPLNNLSSVYTSDKYNFSNYSLNADGSLGQGAGSGVNFAKATNSNLRSLGTELFAINSNILKLDEILATENDRALEDATDDTKVTVKDYVSDNKSNFGDSFTVGSTVTDGLKSDLSTAQASSAVSGLFSPDSGDYWGWFSSDTDANLHPGASSTAIVSLDSEPSAQDVADSETVWVINPYASSSDLIFDFFGGE